jgi:hypothetical protein
MKHRWGPGSWAIASIAIACTAVQAHADLLTNTGFETLDGDLPSGWKVFVAPQPGATGHVVSTDPFDGSRCVQLHIPTPYAVEPANNWSQPLQLERGGVRVRVSGHIKTKDATEAAIWLQCFQRDPWVVLKQVSSSTDSPVYGTMNWTPVAFETLIPESTDFAMIRCVLKGHGSAWFDNVSVTPIGDDEPADRETPIQTAAAEKPVEAPSPVPESISPREEKPVAAPGDNPALDARAKEEQLRESNEALVEQLRQLQAEIAELRDVLKPPRSTAEVRRPPPLVPHGYRWEDHQE